MSKKIVISGAFDPLHPGHLALIEEASKLGEVHIVLNSDDWLIRKKGFYFQPWDDRKQILEAYTKNIHAVDDSDDSVAEALARIKPDYFGNGGDVKPKSIPEHDYCMNAGIEMVFDLGGRKYASSSEVNAKRRVAKRWGWYDVIIDLPNLKIKKLHVDPGKSLSLQRHEKRSEFFFMPNGEVRINLPGVWHVLKAPDDESLDVFEVQVGTSEEEDEEQTLETAKEFAAEVVKKIQLND